MTFRENDCLIGAQKAILINPPIYDTQYWAYWAQPHGLLKIATWLKKNGYTHVRLLDSLATNDKRKISGKKRNSIEIGNINRTVKHFGWPAEKLEEELSKHASNDKDYFFPEEIWITSIMTYWWESTRDIIISIKKVFRAYNQPIPRILIGGIYPTLYPDHARKYLCEETGLSEEKIIVVEGEITQEAADSWTDLTLYEDQMYEAIPKYALITGSRGCPFNCAYCAQLKLNSGNRMVRERGPIVVAEEMYKKYVDHGITEFAFYEDNLLFNKDEFFERLKEIRKRFQNKGIKIEIYAPEGIEPRLVEYELMHEMRLTGFNKIHLALETIDNRIAKEWNRRQATIEKFDKAVDILRKAGFRVGSQDINAFVLFGMPGENLQAAMNTALYASTRVGSVVPMLFTPVPGSLMFENEDFRSYLDNKYKNDTSSPFRDIHLLNGKLLPFLEFNQKTYPDLQASDYLEIESLMMHLNSSKVHGKRFDFNGNGIIGNTFRNIITKRL
jgi:radical SAM superfamily enzyme YgiQ (UPF0313 family)